MSRGFPVSQRRMQGVIFEPGGNQKRESRRSSALLLLILSQIFDLLFSD